MKSLSRIEADNQSFFLMTRTNEEESEIYALDVILTDAINAWSGNISDKDLQDLSRKIGEDLSKFKEETKKALTGVDVGGLIFEYQVTAVKDGCRQLAWKKVMSEDDIKFQLGAVRLVPEDDPSVHIKAIMQHSMEEMAASQMKIQHLQRDQNRLSREREQALKRLEKCVEMKEDLDSDLYSKFCVVLNEKKAKIRQLQQNGTVQATNDDDVAEVETNDGPPSRDEDMEDVSTDEEKEVSRKHKQPKRNVSDDDVENSLILEENEDTKPTTSYGKRRKRKPEVKQPVSSNKPSIPRVPSTPKSTSKQSSSLTRSGRTPSIKSTPSSSRKGQMPELDASDLFEEM